MLPNAAVAAKFLEICCFLREKLVKHALYA